MNLCRNIIGKLLYPFDTFHYYLYMLHSKRQWAFNEINAIASKKRIMVLSPHQDDEILGCGGYLLSASKSASIKVVYTTDGAGRKQSRSESQRKSLAQIRMEEAKLVSSLLNADAPVFLNFPDGDLCDEKKSLRSLLVQEIKKFRPDLLMLPFPTDPHPDHVCTSIALLDISEKWFQSINMCFYHVHAQIPDQFVTDFYGLDKEIHLKKMRILENYSSQLLDLRYERLKHTRLSRVQALRFPQKKYSSVELYSNMTYRQFVNCNQQNCFSELFNDVRALTYSLYSFRNYARNQSFFKKLNNN